MKKFTRMITILVAVAITFCYTVTAQVSVNTDGSTSDGSAVLEVKSNDKGFLPPRINTIEMNAILAPSAGLMVYNTTVNSVCFYDGTGWKAINNKDGESCGTISYGGQTYETVIIGTQCWMAENLNIGVEILGSQNQTNTGYIEKYCYDNNSANCDTYGGLYQWDEMMQYVTTQGTQGICPTGWHIPTDNEWKTMEIALGMSQSEADNTGDRGTDEGGKMKETGTTHWLSPNTGASNTSGFTALPVGYRHGNGLFYNLGYTGAWWSTTEYSGTNVWARYLYYNKGQVNRNNNVKSYGRSVRCLKN